MCPADVSVLKAAALHDSSSSSLLVLFIIVSSCLVLPSCQKHVGHEKVLRVETPTDSSSTPSDSAVTEDFW